MVEWIEAGGWTGQQNSHRLRKDQNRAIELVAVMALSDQNTCAYCTTFRIPQFKKMKPKVYISGSLSFMVNARNAECIPPTWKKLKYRDPPWSDSVAALDAGKQDSKEIIHIHQLVASGNFHFICASPQNTPASALNGAFLREISCSRIIWLKLFHLIQNYSYAM